MRAIVRIKYGETGATHCTMIEKVMQRTFSKETL